MRQLPAIKGMYEAKDKNISVRAICHTLGIPLHIVNSFIKEYKFLRYHETLDFEYIAKQYQSGESSCNLAREYSVSSNRIILILRQENVKIRPRGFAGGHEAVLLRKRLKTDSFVV